MGLQMLDDGHISEQDHLHAFGAAILEVGRGQRVCRSVQTRGVG